MKIDDLAIGLRARNAWEAVDLGAAMLRQWWQPLIRVWLAVYLPAAILAVGVFDKQLWLAIVVLWFLKPLFDRFLLHVLSRAVFGAVPTVGETLREWRTILSPGVLVSITIGRLGIITPVAYASTRSFDLPVLQLERQTGRAARARLAVLRRRATGYAMGLTIVCAHFETILWVGAELLLSFLHPDSSLMARFDWLELGGDQGIGVISVAFYCLAVTIIEPLYVASGFALYLNRRAQLEGWDIELGFRRIADRLGAGLAALLMLVVIALPRPVEAAEAPDPQAAVREVLAGPEFDERRKVERWRLKKAETKPKAPAKPGDGWLQFLALLAETGRAITWIIAALALAFLIYYARRFVRPRALPAAAATTQEPPDTMFGLEISPQTLPDDIVAQARRLIELGRVRLALALLYRAALSALVHRHGVILRESDTEGDCVRAAAGSLGKEAHAYFARLVAAWTLGAYSTEGAHAAVARDLCSEWPRHFAEPAR